MGCVQHAEKQKAHPTRNTTNHLNVSMTVGPIEQKKTENSQKKNRKPNPSQSQPNPPTHPKGSRADDVRTHLANSMASAMFPVDMQHCTAASKLPTRRDLLITASASLDRGWPFDTPPTLTPPPTTPGGAPENKPPLPPGFVVPLLLLLGRLCWKLVRFRCAGIKARRATSLEWYR